MLEAFAALKMARFWLKAAPWVAVALGALAFVLWVRGMQHKIASQQSQIVQLSKDAAAEKAARERDVAALTSLSAGLAKAATDSKKDAQILQETVKDATAPSSPQLRAFIDGLRAQDAQGGPSGATSGARR